MFSAPTSTDLPYVVAASLLGIVLIAAAIVQLRTDRATRSPDDLRYRRRNYFPLALVLGIAVFLIPDVVDEIIPTHHIDEFIDYSMGAVALIWLFWPGLRFRPVTVWPVIAGLALFSNLLGLVIEHAACHQHSTRGSPRRHNSEEFPQWSFADPLVSIVLALDQPR